ncbi:hypothetical protein NTGZN8_100118 [Candidatus Nitrotoga fabula]|uniref:Uncharacterized protein n=1 Tax=Candidatus Nitrotoga fabula TaxID=2182327 RepID=A0A916BCJ7_9PROT|nr:hypothetical protein NTGZN8_100118 [Candidatus Nitrotoga fabula]
MGLKAHAYTANTGEKVNEAETTATWCCADNRFLQEVSQCGFKHRRARRFAFFPSSYGFGVFTYVLGYFALRESISGLFQKFKRLGMYHFSLSGNFCGHYDLYNSFCPGFCESNLLF